MDEGRVDEPGMDEGVGEGSLGLIAGAGQLPIEAARLLRRSGYSLFAVAFEGLTDPALAREVSEVRWLRLGQLDRMVSAMRDMGVRRLILLGKVSKTLLFGEPKIADPDVEAMRLLFEIKDRADEPLMSAIAGWLEDRNFVLCGQGEILAEMLAPLGVMSARTPSAVELADLAVGRPIVAQLGRIGIGQCVVVKHGSVLAVEAIEGTDAAILRAGELGGQGATVIKAARPGQDRRFDLPAVGTKTIEALQRAGATGLAIEGGSTLMIDRQKMLEAADLAKIAVWGFSIAHNTGGTSS